MVNNSNEITQKPYGLEDIVEIREGPDAEFYSLVEKDALQFKKNVFLDTTPEIYDFHLVNAVHGHALEGDGEFRVVRKMKIPYKRNEKNKGSKYKRETQKIRIIYKNVFHKDITDALVSKKLKISNAKVVTTSWNELQNLYDWSMNAIDALYDPKKRGPENFRLAMVKKSGGSSGSKTKTHPLCGIEMFKYHVLTNLLSPLIGIYLGSTLDSDIWRQKVVDWRNSEDPGNPISLHQGTCGAIDVQLAKKKGLYLSDFASNVYRQKLGLTNEDKDKTIEILQNLKLFSKKSRNLNSDRYKAGYVQFIQGYGSSDDAAFINVTLMRGIEAGFGFLLADGADTLDKNTKFTYKSGFDEYLGKSIKEYYEYKFQKPFPVSEKEILTFIYLSMATGDTVNHFPSSSQRRFWQRNGAGLTAVQSHMSFINYLKGKSSSFPFEIRLSNKGVKNEKFYSAYLRHLSDSIDKGIIQDKYNIIEKNEFVVETVAVNGVEKLLTNELWDST